jgi:hypothetical protein
MLDSLAITVQIHNIIIGNMKTPSEQSGIGLGFVVPESGPPYPGITGGHLLWLSHFCRQPPVGKLLEPIAVKIADLRCVGTGRLVERLRSGDAPYFRHQTKKEYQGR